MSSIFKLKFLSLLLAISFQYQIFDLVSPEEKIYVDASPHTLFDNYDQYTEQVTNLYKKYADYLSENSYFLFLLSEAYLGTLYINSRHKSMSSSISRMQKNPKSKFIRK